MICDNQLIVEGATSNLVDVELAFENLSDYDNFTDFVLKEILDNDIKKLHELEFTIDKLKDVKDIQDIPSVEYIDLFGTKWIDITAIEPEYGYLKSSIRFESKATPPLALLPLLSDKFNVSLRLESVESYSDRAYVMTSESFTDYEVEYMTYYEFQYNVKKDFECLEQLIPFYFSFDTMIEDLEKDNIFLTEKHTESLRKTFNKLSVKEL